MSKPIHGACIEFIPLATSYLARHKSATVRANVQLALGVG